MLVAVGAHAGGRLRIPGVELPGTITAVDFLRRVNLGEDVVVGERVVVLGGGNVAFDCARVARRLGAREVLVSCLEPRDAMLAAADEIAEGEEEGVVIQASRTFSRFTEDQGRVTGVECLLVESFAFDDDGRLEIEQEWGSDHTLPADTIILAVGQRPEVPEEWELDLTPKGTIELDSYSGGTSREGVFAAGDAVSGTASVIKAIASGRAAATAIDRYLGGDGRSGRGGGAAAGGARPVAGPGRGLRGPAPRRVVVRPRRGAADQLLPHRRRARPGRRQGRGGALPAVRPASEDRAGEVLGRVLSAPPEGSGRTTDERGGRVSELRADVIVVAAGASGLPAALEAARAGASVLVFEKGATTGGTGSMGMGPFGVESRMQKLKQMGPTRDEAFKQFMDYTHWRVDARLVRAYIDKAATTIDWLEDLGVRFMEPAAYFPGGGHGDRGPRSGGGRQPRGVHLGVHGAAPVEPRPHPGARDDDVPGRVHASWTWADAPARRRRQPRERATFGFEVPVGRGPS